MLGQELRLKVDYSHVPADCPRKQMAANLANLEDDWEVDYHAKWGQFNRENTCHTPAWGKSERSMSSAFGHHGGGGGGNQPNACCGKEGEL